MVFLNKHLLNSKELKVYINFFILFFKIILIPLTLKFDAPLFVTWYQCIFSIFMYLIWFLASQFFSNIIKFSNEINLNHAIKV